MTGSDRRLAFLITGLNHGGAETQLLRLADAFRARGWEVLVVSVLPPGDFSGALAGIGVRVESLGLRRATDLPRAARTLVRLLRGWRPSILTSFLFHANLLGRFAGRIARVPVVISSERSDRFGGRYRYWLLRLTDPWAAATVTNSKRVGERLVRERVIHPSRLRVIPNAIREREAPEEGSDRGAVRAALGVHEDEFLWVAVGRIDPAKDYATLLRAFARHRREHPRARLRIAGAGTPDAVLTGLLSSLDLTECVRFLGHRGDVRDLLEAADAFVMSSRLEGFPNALMEALAAGLPAVGTDAGGIPELIEDGVSGFVVPAGNADDLAGAMGRLAALPGERRRRMGRTGTRHVLEACSMPHVVGMWESLFSQLTGGDGNAGGHIAPAPPPPEAPLRAGRRLRTQR